MFNIATDRAVRAGRENVGEIHVDANLIAACAFELMRRQPFSVVFYSTPDSPGSAPDEMPAGEEMLSTAE
jgi:hypothetical protein